MLYELERNPSPIIQKNGIVSSSKSPNTPTSGNKFPEEGKGTKDLKPDKVSKQNGSINVNNGNVQGISVTSSSDSEPDEILPNSPSKDVGFNLSSDNNYPSPGTHLFYKILCDYKHNIL